MIKLSISICVALLLSGCVSFIGIVEPVPHQQTLAPRGECSVLGRDNVWRTCEDHYYGGGR